MGEPVDASSERNDVRELRSAGRASVVVIGAGINGISVFRELAVQGVEVALVERGDFASGASAASSHMIHGGIRYLENGEFRLVRESVRERNALLRLAPHYVKPLKTTIPIYSTFSGILSAPVRLLTHGKGKRTERGAALIKAGLTVYDMFSRAGGPIPRHSFQGRKRALKELPELDPQIKFAATYFDASMHDPERLALDVLMDGAGRHSRAYAVNYVEAISMSGRHVRLRDRETGTEFDLQADIVVNASGPWTDLTNEALGQPTQYMGGTKGSHIVLDCPALSEATGGREIFFEHTDGRIVLIYPLKDRVLVGTTDIDADPRVKPVCTDEEVDYFFELIQHVFPRVSVSREQIVYRFSGIRPLPRHEDTTPGFVSRDYRVETDDSGEVPVMSLVGGKWTTFRALGEALADQVLARLGLRRTQSTAHLPIGGGEHFPKTASARAKWFAANLPDAGGRADVLFARYGTRAAEVYRYLCAGTDTPIAGGELSDREVMWMAEHEKVVRLLDVVMRRTSLAFTGALDTDLIKRIAVPLASALGWDSHRCHEEILQAVTALNEHHGLNLHSP